MSALAFTSPSRWGRIEERVPRPPRSKLIASPRLRPGFLGLPVPRARERHFSARTAFIPQTLLPFRSAIRASCSTCEPQPSHTRRPIPSRTHFTPLGKA